jgi:hypothetical protein
MRSWAIGFVLTVGALFAPARAQNQPDSDRAGLDFFETSIRPLLIENCYSCHGEKKQKGELRLDSRASAMRGGELGVVLIPGKPDDSLLIKAVRYADADLQMPPKKKLSQKQIDDLTKWVNMGAPWPEDKTTLATTPSTKPAAIVITDADRNWWSFRPISPKTPDIDLCIEEKLKEKGLTPNPPASKSQLIRRAYFDLWGLPPTAREVAAFESNSSPDAFEKVIDHLLASPRYGERWARFWLDVVRYAQTNGYERDSEKPYAWRYRDYVIRALNEDKPYDQFIREQLAGDEIDNVTDDSLIATGFYRLGVWDDEPDDKKTADYDYLDDNIRTISTAFLGLTVACARCHEHKFDPIPQSDYYSLLAFIRNVKPHEGPKYTLDSATFAPIGDREKAHAQLAEMDRKAKELKARLDKADKEEKKKIEAQIKEISEQKVNVDWALVVRENGSQIPQTHLLLRGNASAPGPIVQPAFLSVLGGQPATPAKTNGSTTGLRIALANWLTSKNHPLTARVMVNRLWQHHFSRGIVPTPDDFGKTGLPPTHPELLDSLASSFMQSGWSIKKMHKLIMLSDAYRRSSRVNEQSAAIDPDNQLFWRQSMHRLEAEAIRDSVLLVSGELNETQGGRGFFPRMSREVIAGGSRPGDGWELSLPDELNRRSIYAYTKRTMGIPMLDTFDTTNTALPSGERTITTVAPQVLMLLNDRFMHERAEALARRIVSDVGNDPIRQVESAYELALSRKPTSRESALALQYLQRQISSYQSLRTRLRFEPDVPSSVYGGYLKKLSASDLLFGPKAGWKYARGVWGGGYEGILNVDPAQGPAALADGTKFLDGTVQGRILINNGCDLAGLIARGKLSGEELASAYDLVLSPKTHSVLLRRLGPVGEGPPRPGSEGGKTPPRPSDKRQIQILAAAGFPIDAGQWFDLKLQLSGDRLSGYVNGKRILLATDPKPLSQGQAGIRIWGAALDIDSLSISRGESPEPLYDGKNWGPTEKALASLAVALFNLNEFVYVD